MQITDKQISAAKACGISFIPASVDQVQRLSMQRKVFQIGGKPHLATGDGSLFETAATLTRLIENYQIEQDRQQGDLEAWRASGTVAEEPANSTAKDDTKTVPLAASEVQTSAPTSQSEEPPPGKGRGAASRQNQRLRSDNPRWMTAGAARRGRLGQHWTVRRRR